MINGCWLSWSADWCHVITSCLSSVRVRHFCGRFFFLLLLFAFIPHWHILSCIFASPSSSVFWTWNKERIALNVPWHKSFSVAEAAMLVFSALSSCLTWSQSMTRVCCLAGSPVPHRKLYCCSCNQYGEDCWAAVVSAFAMICSISSLCSFITDLTEERVSQISAGTPLGPCFHVTIHPTPVSHCWVNCISIVVWN